MEHAGQSGSTVHTGCSTDSSRPRRILPANFSKYVQDHPHIHDNERREVDRRPNRDLHSDFDDEAFDEEDLPPPAPPSPNSLDDEHNKADGQANEDTFDTLDDFGEDTLHALMDSDIMLGGMPPLASLRNRAGSNFKIEEGDRHHEDYDDDYDESLDKEELDEKQLETTHEEINNDEFTTGDEDDGTMASSLLRGPLMAAKSFMNFNANRGNAATTPSTARAQFLMSAMKPSINARLTIDDTAMTAPHDKFQRLKSDATPHSQQQCTPSTARSSFLSNKNGSSKSSVPTPPTATPSNLVISTQKPPLGQRNGAARTPSAQRGDFITSPQDSVSTMGSGQSMDHVVYRQNKITLTAGERNSTPSGERQKFMNSPQDSLTSHGIGRVFTFRDSDSCEENDTANIARGAIVSTTPQSNNSASEISKPKSSVDRLIALGEEQMKQAASISASNFSAKNSFLRKGSRKEPSALHTLDVAPTTATAITTSKGTPSNETASERKARIARLEKMQEDLRRDYERREARKEEAQRERRRLKLTEMGSRGVLTQSALKNARGHNHGEESVTPSQARARSVSRSRMVDCDKNNPTPSTTRARSAVRSGRSMIDTPKSTKAKDVQTPVRARSALKSKKDEANTLSSSQVRLETKQTLHVQYDDGLVENAGVEESKNDVQSNANEEALLDESTAPAAPAPVSEQNPRNYQQNNKTPFSQRRPRSASRLKITQSKPAARSPSPKQSVINNTKSNDEMTFEDWKRREGEEWALIKNMRKRQEAALREAEGERERVSCDSVLLLARKYSRHYAYQLFGFPMCPPKAKAWALAEIDSTKKWVEEQRALIKKDRHKAANAALLATKKAEKIKATTESNALTAELEELRSQIQKMKLEAEEAKKLKEQVRKQEKTILALKSQRGDVTSPKEMDEETNARRIFKDCTSSQTNKVHSKSMKPKTPQNASSKDFPVQEARKMPTPIIDPNKRKDTFSVEEEPTDRFPEQHLSDLNNASTKHEPGMQLNNDATATAPVSTGHDVLANIQRKPYNAADYGPTHAKSTSEAPVKGVSPAFSNLNAASAGTPKTTQLFTYQNGTRKEVLSDGTTTVYFTNGDRKRTYANEKKGIVVYYYAATQTTQVTHQDGKQTYHFPNKQIEDHYVDGTKEISYPDGTKRTIFTDGTTDTTFPDGVRVVDYLDGTQQVHQVC
ncbi:hypothetical protein ACHAW6_009774 [Cyclotella cf. meneghiniana]